MDGAGNSSSLLNYLSYDEEPSLGISYYRLKQTDFDGRFGYSKVVIVDNKGYDNIIKLYPNPAIEETTLFLQADYAGEVIITLYDLTGRKVSRQTEMVLKNRTQKKYKFVSDERNKKIRKTELSPV